MNIPFQQTDRSGTLQTVLGRDVLNIARMDAEESLNGLFTVNLVALAARNDLDFDAVLGTHATATLTAFAGPETHFDGIVTEAELIGPGDGGWQYRLVLRPWFWLLGLRRKQQIYHEMTVVEILEELFAPYAGLGEPAFENRLGQTYPTLEYTVQYRESDLDFACRMMERFGISYHFTHDAGSHTLVLTDSAESHDPVPGEMRPYQIVTDGHRKDAEHFWDMRPARRLTTGAIRLTDYNFKHPSATMETARTGDAAYEQGQIESYEYPGDYLDENSGKDVARLRVQQERGQDPRHRATGNATSLRAGHRVMVTGDPVPGVGAALCLSARHRFANGGFGSDSGKDGEDYEGEYLLMPAEAPLVPERKTRPAIVQGPQTAVVVGEGEIDCDEYGRILVCFHWDLDRRYSMRCRVSQNWAGKGWGGMVIPRIGMEVVVEFLEGDPDKPLVTGCVYNGKNDVPYPLPQHKTRSTFKTDTHKGTGFNELRFEDERGEEEIYLHAERDLHRAIENDAATFIGGSQFKVVDRLSHETVQISKSTLTGVSETHNVGRSYKLSVGEGTGTAAMLSLGARKSKERFGPMKALLMTRTAVLPPGYYKSVDGDNAAVITGDSSEGVGGTKSISAGGQVSIASELNVGVTADADMMLSAEGTQVLTSGKELILRCGQSEIRMTSAGKITINGTRIELN